MLQSKEDRIPKVKAIMDRETDNYNSQSIDKFDSPAAQANRSCLDPAPDFPLVTSEHSLAGLAALVATQLHSNGFPKKPALHRGLQDFLETTYSSPYAREIAFVRQKKTYAPFILDVHVLWTSPIDLDIHTPEIQRLRDDFAHNLEVIRPSIHCFLTIDDVRDYPSPETFKAKLSAPSSCPISSNLIVCARLDSLT